MTPETANGGVRPGAEAAGVCQSCPSQAEPDRDWPRALVSKLGVALVFKLAVLAALWWWFFSPAHRPDAHGPAVAQHLLSESGNPR